MLQLILANAGYRTMGVFSAAEATAAMEQNHIDGALVVQKLPAKVAQTIGSTAFVPDRVFPSKDAGTLSRQLPTIPS